MITKKDIQIIKDCILKSGIKDSEFKKYEANLTGEEYITIVVDNNNYKVKVKDFVTNSSTIIHLKGLDLPSTTVDMGSWPDYNNPLDGDYVFALNNLYKYVDGAWLEQLPSSNDIYAVYNNSLYKISYKDNGYTVTKLLMGGGDYDLSDFMTEEQVDIKIANALSRIPSNSDDVNDILTLLNGLNAKVIQLKAAEVTPDTTYSEAIAPISDTIWDNGQQGDYVWTMDNGLQGFNPNSQSWETNYGVTDPNKTFVVWKNVIYKLEQNGATKLMDLNKIIKNLTKSGIIEFVDDVDTGGNPNFNNAVEGQYTYYNRVLYHKENGKLVVVTDLDWDNTLFYNYRGLYKYNPNDGFTIVYEPSSSFVTKFLEAAVLYLRNVSSFILNLAYYGVDANLPNVANYKSGDLIMLVNSLDASYELYIKRENLFKSYTLCEGTDVDIDDPRVFIAYKGNLWKVNRDTCELECVLAGGKYELFVLNHTIPKELGTVTWDTFVDSTCKVIAGITIEECDVLQDYAESRYPPKYILCFEDDILYEFYDGDGAYHNYTEYVRTCPSDVYFINSGVNEIYKLDKTSETFDRVLTAEVISSLSSNSKHPVLSKVLFTEFNKKADKLNTALSGIPTAPTAATGTNTNLIATTKFVYDVVNAAMLEDADVDLTGILEDIDTLYDTKLEIIKVKYLVDDLTDITNPVANDKAILFSEGSTPVLYSYNSGSWSEQGVEANTHLLDSNVGIVYDNKLIQWNSSANTFKTLVGINIDNALSADSDNPVKNKVIKQALDNKASTSALNAKAPISSPAFTGTPTATTPQTTDNSTRIATTAFVKQVIQALNIPTFTPGSSTEIYAVDAICDDTLDILTNSYNTAILIDTTDVVLWIKNDGVTYPLDLNDYTSIILDASNLFIACNRILYKFNENQREFVEILNANLQIASTITSGGQLPVKSSAIYAALGNKANLSGPTFTGVPTAPTATAGTDTNQIATTAFVKAAVDAAINSLDLSSALANANIDNSDIPDAAYKYNINDHAWVNSQYDERPVTLGDIKKLMDLGFIDALANYMVALDARLNS